MSESSDKRLEVDAMPSPPPQDCWVHQLSRIRRYVRLGSHHADFQSPGQP